MPIYEYVCPECRYPFEKLVSFSQADRPQSCPECGNAQATKQISRVAPHAGGSNGPGAQPGPACGPIG